MIGRRDLPPREADLWEVERFNSAELRAAADRLKQE
jgi:hypothetical protein